MNINVPNQKRPCPCCASEDFESLWSYEHVTKTRTKYWFFNVHNVICKTCGFVFTSPAADSQVLLQYYQDSFSTFMNQNLDYDFEKRMDIIRRYGGKGKYLEIGANQKTKFHNELEKIYSKVYTVEPNSSVKNEFRSLGELPEIEVDCVASYFVLEHIPDIDSFLKGCSKVLKDQAFFICEVPALELYDKFLSPLILFEHVNHFTKMTLANIASKYGFELVHFSYEDCSRPYGFVSVFQKKKTSDFKFYSEFEQNKILFKKGMDLLAEFFGRIKKASELISMADRSDEVVIVYAANETTRRLLPCIKQSKNVIVVDTDPRKKDFFDNEIKVYQPNEIKEKLYLAKYLILCTERHAKVILSSLKNEFNKTFRLENIMVVDIR
ncbi:methyltransferase domain protein [Leptospira weilii serovar Topaz str. LT2116]|uniref:Methyltransferase domain protein n=1 Tax=Leptospira weilii serovar Topaz str. LT2116 TaxID=1088540 RepID=M3G369_9LEPT|nr:methyltransferase domain protein [Leptospira weilii serovar Topaz str. LT2116]